MKLLPPRVVAARLGVSTRTLARWEESGRLVPISRLASGARRYSEAQLLSLSGEPVDVHRVRAAVYSRVSSSKQQRDGNLDRQRDRLLAEVAERGWVPTLVVSEVASGVNERRRGLHRVLLAARKGQIDVVVVEFRDRLARFGAGYLVAALDASGVELVVIDEPSGAKEPAQELVDDLLAIVMVFAARLYGQRGAAVRRRVAEVLRSEPVEPSGGS